MAQNSIAQKIKEVFVGTEENLELQKSQQRGLEIMRDWRSTESVHSEIKNRTTNNRDLYLGRYAQQFSQNTEGTLRIVSNLSATVMDLILYILTNTPPSIQAIPASASKLDQAEAATKEQLIKKAFDDANFKRKFRDAISYGLFSGHILFFTFWNKKKEFGKTSSKFDISVLNPITTRIIFSTTDFDEIESFITSKRATPEWIAKRYNVTVMPDQEDPFLDREVFGEGIEDGKTTIFKRYDNEKVETVINSRVVETKSHDLDFVPGVFVQNKKLINEAMGLDEFARFKDIAQEINALVSAASEIARDLAYPPILEYNGALGAQKIQKWRGKKIPVRKTDKGEAVEYMLNRAQIGPLLEQIKLLIDLFHFVSLMPKAAAGIFESSVTSGFQAKLSMQPATLNTDNKKIDLEEAIIRMARIALYMIEKNDPESLRVAGATEGEEVKFEDIWEGEFQVTWPENLPVDISREIQNLILGIQNSLTSVTQSIDKYNALMGLGSPEDTKDYLKQEAQDANLAPERALKVAQVEKALSDIKAATQAMEAQLSGGQNGPIAENNKTQEDIRNTQNPVNLARTDQSGGRTQPVPDTAREALPPESTGGSVLPGI